MRSRTRAIGKKYKVRIAVLMLSMILLVLMCIGYIHLRPTLATQSLIHAIKYDNLSEAKTALNQGADPNALVGLAEGWDGAELEESNIDLANSLLGKQLHSGIRETPLFLATEEGKDDIAQLLISRGADVRFNDGTGSTPLMWAAQNGSAETVRMLINKGADVNSRWKDGTPLINNAQGRPEILSILKQAGAKEYMYDHEH